MRRAVVVTVAAVVAMSGCSQADDSSDPADPTDVASSEARGAPSTPASAIPGPQGLPGHFRTGPRYGWTADEAWGTEAVLDLRTAIGPEEASFLGERRSTPGDYRQFMGVADDGSLFVNPGTRFVGDGRGDIEEPVQSALSMIDPDTSEATVLAGLADDAEIRMGGGVDDYDGAWAVWTESSSIDLMSNPWVMYSYEFATGERRRIGEAAAPEGVPSSAVPRAYEDTLPVLGGDGRVYFGAIDADGDPRHTVREATDVYSLPLRGGEEPRLEIEQAHAPMVRDGELVVQQSLGAEGDNHRVRILSRPVRERTAGFEVVARFDYDLWQESFAFDPLGGLIWGARESQMATTPSAIFRTSPAGGDDLLVAVGTKSTVKVDAVTDRSLAFTVETAAGDQDPRSTYVYHFGTGELVRFDDAEVAIWRSSDRFLVGSVTGEFDSPEGWYAEVAE